MMPSEPDNRTVSVHHGYLVSRVHNREESIQLSYTVSKMSLLSTVALSKNVVNRLIKQVDDEQTQTQEVTTLKDHKFKVSVKFIENKTIRK